MLAHADKKSTRAAMLVEIDVAPKVPFPPKMMTLQQHRG
jgi:hypothetical protein